MLSLNVKRANWYTILKLIVILIYYFILKVALRLKSKISQIWVRTLFILYEGSVFKTSIFF